MSILIKGMKIPKDCQHCFNHFDCGRLHILGERHPDCPLVEVPEPYGEHLCEDEVVSCLEGADWINEVIRIFLDLQAEGTE